MSRSDRSCWPARNEPSSNSMGERHRGVTQLARSSDRTMRVQAESARAVRAFALGEIKFATRILKSLYRNAADETERSFARQRLVELFARLDDLDSTTHWCCSKCSDSPMLSTSSGRRTCCSCIANLGLHGICVVGAGATPRSTSRAASEHQIGWVPTTRDTINRQHLKSVKTK